MLETRVKRGQQVKCELTGIEGLVTSIAVEENGNIRIGIQPKSSDNKMLDPFFSDETSVVVLGEGISAKALSLQETHIRLGYQVRDRISGYNGTVTNLIWYINGCVHALVTSPYLERAKTVVQAFPVTRLDVTLPLTQSQQQPTGGPITTDYARR